MDDPRFQALGGAPSALADDPRFTALTGGGTAVPGGPGGEDPRFKPLQEPTSFLGNVAGSVGQGVAQGGLNILKGGALAAGGIAGAIGDTSDRDAFFEAVRKENAGEEGTYGKSIKDFFAEHGMQPQGLGEKASNLIAGITSLASPGTAILGMGGGASETIDRLDAKGVDANTALTIAEGEFAGNVAGGALFPMAAGKVIGSPTLASAAGMAAQGAAMRAATSSYLDAQGYHEQAQQEPAWNDPESLINDAVFGAVAHGMFGEKPQEKPNPPNTQLKEVDELLRKKAAGQDVDTSQAINPYNVAGTVEQPHNLVDENGQLRPVKPDVSPDKRGTYGDMQAEADAKAEGTLGPLPEGLKLPEEPTSGKKGPLLGTDARLDLLEKKLGSTRQAIDEAAAKNPNLNARMENGRELTPDEHVINAEMEQGHPQDGGIPALHEANLNPDVFWNGTLGAKSMKALMGEDGRLDPMLALKWMANNSASYVRNVANSLMRMPTLMKNLEIQMLKGMFEGCATKGGAAGQYNPSTHRIRLGTKQGGTDQVIAHEMVHGATSRAVYISELARGAFPKMDALNDALKSILENIQSKGQKKTDYTDETGFHHTGDTYDFSGLGFTDIPRGRVYGLTNVHEMISEAFTNAGFRELLKSVGAWEPMKKGMRDFIGSDKSALDQILKLSEGLMKYHEQNASEISKILMKEFAKRGDANTRVLNSPEREMSDEADRKGLFKNKQVDSIVKNLPGGKVLDSSYIPDYPDPKTVVNQALLEPDLDRSMGTKIVQNLTVSAEQYANLARSKALFMATQIYSRGQKLGHFYNETIVKPLRDAIKATIPDSQWKDLKTIKDIMIKEDFANTRLSKDELAKFLNPKQQKVYDAIRKARDEAIDHINDKRQDLGYKPITPRDAYATSHWSGGYKAEVHSYVRDAEGKIKLDKDGNLQTRLTGMLSGRTPQEVRRGMKWVKNNHPDLAEIKDIYDQRSFNASGRDYLQAYEDLQKIMGKNDPDVQSVTRAIQQMTQEEAMNTENFAKHFEQKSGARYFEGDRPWIDPRKDTMDWFRNQFDNLEEGYKWAGMQEATGVMKKITSDRTMLKERPNMVAYLKEHSKAQLGFGKLDSMGDLEKKFFSTVGGIADMVGLHDLPLDVRAGMTMMRQAKNLIYMKALGFWKPQHFLVNGVFQPMFTMPRHMKLSSEGYSHNALQTFTLGMRDAQAILANHYMRGNGPELSDFAKDMKKYIETNGIATNNPWSDMGDLGRSRWDWAAHKIQAFGGYFMQEGERVSRINAFASFAHHLEQSGKFDTNTHEGKMELFRNAERNTTETMSSFRHTDRPLFFTKLGLIGTGLATLRQFEINFYNQMHDYAKYAWETKNYKPLMAFCSIQMAFAGVLGFVGAETLDALYRWIRDMIPTRFVSREFAQWSPKQAILQHLPLLASRGIVSPWTGVNMASSLEMGTIVDPSLEGLFPFLSELDNTSTPVWKYISNPTSDNLHRMIYQETPYGSRGMLETGKIFGQDLPAPINTRSWFTAKNAGGRDVSLSPTTLEGQYARGQTQAFGQPASEENIRSWGFMPTQEAMTKEGIQMSKQNEQMLKERQDSQLERIESGVRNGDIDQIAPAARKYIEMSGDPYSAVNNERFQKMLMEWHTTFEQRAALGAVNYEGALKYQRLQQYLQQIKEYYGPRNATK